jgi:hypothetical protein
MLVAVITIIASGSATGQKGGPPVVDTRVVNTAAHPVPVTIQGSAQIDSDSPISVRDVDQPARQPFAATLHFVFEDGNRNAFAHLGVVPAGKRLVVESVSYKANVISGQIAEGAIRVTTNGKTCDYMVPPVFVRTFLAGATQVDRFLGEAAVRLYADPGTEVIGVFDRFVTNKVGDGDVTVAGYLVDL